MIYAIKEICIFMIIAQAILLLAPGNSYMKYVRVLVGIIMILMITRPIFALFMGEEKQEDFARQLEEIETKLRSGEAYSDFLEQQEEKEDMMENTEQKIEIEPITIGEEERIMITDNYE